jgi:hypothetical protein
LDFLLIFTRVVKRKAKSTVSIQTLHGLKLVTIALRTVHRLDRRIVELKLITGTMLGLMIGISITLSHRKMNLNGARMETAIQEAICGETIRMTVGIPAIIMLRAVQLVLVTAITAVIGQRWTIHAMIIGAIMTTMKPRRVMDGTEVIIAVEVGRAMGTSLIPITIWVVGIPRIIILVGAKLALVVPTKTMKMAKMTKRAIAGVRAAVADGEGTLRMMSKIGTVVGKEIVVMLPGAHKGMETARD